MGVSNNLQMTKKKFVITQVKKLVQLIPFKNIINFSPFYFKKPKAHKFAKQEIF